MAENAETPFVVGYSRSTSATTKHLRQAWDVYSLCHRRVTDFDGVYPSLYKLRCESLPVCKTCQNAAEVLDLLPHRAGQAGAGTVDPIPRPIRTHRLRRWVPSGT